MSRNKIIKFVHDRTGKSYAECRKICKTAHWNEATIIVYTLADATGIFTKSINQICAALKDVAAQISKSFSILYENAADSTRKQSERMRALAKPFDVNKGVFNYSEPFDVKEDMFNYSDTVTASILNPSEVRASCIAEDLKIEEMRDQLKPKTTTIDELREQFGLQPIDVNDPKTPVFAPYYASKAKDGKLHPQFLNPLRQ